MAAKRRYIVVPEGQDCVLCGPTTLAKAQEAALDDARDGRIDIFAVGELVGWYEAPPPPERYPAATSCAVCGGTGWAARLDDEGAQLWPCPACRS